MRLLFNPYAPLAIFALATIAVLFSASRAGTRATEVAEVLLSITWFWLVVIWMDLDAILRRRRPCYDFGLLAYVTFPASLVWYCIHSRGWGRGLLTLLGLIALWLAPWVLVALLWAVVYGA